jgi:hypothetical protein
MPNTIASSSHAIGDVTLLIPLVQTLTDLARSNKKMGIITKKKNNSSEKG